MPANPCPNRDGSTAQDPYGAGIVACAADGCGLRFHRPCVDFFQTCPKCRNPLRTKLVFDVAKPAKKAVFGERGASTNAASGSSAGHSAPSSAASAQAAPSPPGLPARPVKFVRNPTSAAKPVIHPLTETSSGCLLLAAVLLATAISVWLSF
jgi:hypothetical protein